MLNIGPSEIVALCVVGLILLGPDRLPELARGAARAVRALRDLTHDTRSQLRDEIGPEICELRLADLSPRRAIGNALLGEPGEYADLRPDKIAAELVDASTSDAPLSADLPPPEPVAPRAPPSPASAPPPES